MAQKTAARGRPKGTGLDDTGALAAIADMIGANPGMKPTTAIKALGITDPSTVRRLRDKYQQRHAPAEAMLPAMARAPIVPRPDNVIALRTRTQVVRRDTGTPAVPSAPAISSSGGTPDEPSSIADEHPAREAVKARPDLFAAAYAASIATAKTAIHLHYKSLWYAFHWSPYACVLRNSEFTRLVLSSLKDKDNNPRCSRPED